MSNKLQTRGQKRGRASSTTSPVLLVPALLPNDDADFDEEMNEAARKLVKRAKKQQASFKRRTSKKICEKLPTPSTSSRPKRVAAQPLPAHVFDDNQEDDDNDAHSDNLSQSQEEQDGGYDILSDSQSQTIHEQSDEDSLLSDSQSQLLQQN